MSVGFERLAQSRNHEDSGSLSVGDNARVLLRREGYRLFFTGDDSVRVEEGKEECTLWFDKDQNGSQRGIKVRAVSPKTVGISFTGITHNGVEWVGALDSFYEELKIPKEDTAGLQGGIESAMSRAKPYLVNGVSGK